VIIKQAPEPCDIIWENKEVTDDEQSSQKCRARMIIIFLILLTLLISFLYKFGLLKYEKKYPDVERCAYEDLLQEKERFSEQQEKDWEI